MKTKTKAIILNSLLLLFFVLIYFFISKYLWIQQSENGFRNWLPFDKDISMLRGPFDINHTPFLPLAGIFMCLGLKGYFWFFFVFMISFLSLRNLCKFIFRKSIADWELEVLIFSSIALLNIALFIQFYEYNKIDHYQAIPATYLRMFQISIYSVMITSAIVSSFGVSAYFLGRIKRSFNKPGRQMSSVEYKSGEQNEV